VPLNGKELKRNMFNKDKRKNNKKTVTKADINAN